LREKVREEREGTWKGEREKREKGENVKERKTIDDIQKSWEV
jgi:hypothetical protein